MRLYEKGSNVPVEAKLIYDGQTKKATLVPNAPLKKGTTYRVEVLIWNLDWAGNYLDQKPLVSGNKPKVWRFTVAN